MSDPLVFECMVRVGRTPVAGGNAVSMLAGAYGFTVTMIGRDQALMSYADGHMVLRARMVELINRLHGIRVEVTHYSISLMLLDSSLNDPLNLLKENYVVKAQEPNRSPIHG